MKAYFLGAVHVWCRDRHGEWFSARDLVGGANYLWEKTPLYPLYKHYLEIAVGNEVYAFSESGKAVGRLLKKVLADDEKRQYETEVRYTRVYRWVGKETLGLLDLNNIERRCVPRFIVCAALIKRLKMFWKL